MFITDTYIKGREKLLNGILGIDLRNTINPDGLSNPPVPSGFNLAAEIKKSINQFKALAMDDNGETVDYQQLSLNPVYQSYRELTSQLHHFDYTALPSLEDRLAFWINLYNTLVINAVIQENVKNSVTESRLGILSFFQRAAYSINGQRFSLTDMEHGVIRGNRGFPYFPGPHFAGSDSRRAAVIDTVDPRIHFALNCASNSCPPIGVYTPEGLNAQLDLATSNFLHSDLKLDKNQDKISISRIFNWYQVDFGGKMGTIKFIGKHTSDPELKLWISEHRDTIRLSYHPYDWGLNRNTKVFPGV